MTEHLDAHRLPIRALDVFVTYLIRDAFHLLHIQLASKHHNIGKLRIETHSICICHIDLSRDVNFLTDLTRIKNCSHIGRNDSRNACLLGTIDDIVKQRNIRIIDHRIYCQIGFYPMTITFGNDIVHIVHSEICTRTRTHIQTLDTEIDSISTGAESSSQRLPTTDGSHYLKIFAS